MNVTVKAKISDDWKKVVKKVQTLGGVKGVKIGIVEKATNSHTGANIAEYAFFNEFGTNRIPARPFMRLTAEKHSKEWAVMFVQATGGKIIQDPNVARRAFTMIGRVAMSDMKEMIMSNIPPENAPATKAKKQSKKNFKQGAYTGTLYDTGEMAQSINFQLYSREEGLNA